MTVDEKDRLILSELRKDARKPTKHIAESIGIPRVTVHTRIEKMKERGVIKQFTVLTDFEKLGLPVTAYVFVSFSSNGEVSQRQLAKDIAKITNVYEVHLISGEWDILLKVRGESLEQIGQIVLDELRPMKGVDRTITCPCFSVVKNLV